MHPEILAGRSLTLHTEPTFIITDPCKVAERENWKERLIIKWNEKILYYLVFRNTAFLHKDFTSWIYVTWYAPVREGLRKTALLDEDNSCIRSDRAMCGHLPEKGCRKRLTEHTNEIRSSTDFRTSSVESKRFSSRGWRHTLVNSCFIFAFEIILCCLVSCSAV